jgi:AraC family transcriptional regulator of adaptative response/methylated-DNA-[protein]-cysteine methyltransferase
MLKPDRTYQQIAKAIDYFSRYQLQQPSLAELSQHIGVSESHLQRLFSDWVGVSPKKFLQYLTKEKAKQLLLNSTVMEAALDAGLSSVGRLHDLMITCEGVTPGDYKRFGAGLTIYYGIHDSPFGDCLLAITDKGVCKLAFFDQAADSLALINELKLEWPQATIERDDTKTAILHAVIFPQQTPSSAQPQRLNLLLKGSKFQLKVWEALLSVPEGNIVSYQQMAVRIGEPAATRAVASAIARNSIGYLIPCHRVIRSTGAFSQYRWGAQRKQAMIAWEACSHLPD